MWSSLGFFWGKGTSNVKFRLHLLFEIWPKLYNDLYLAKCNARFLALIFPGSLTAFNPLIIVCPGTFSSPHLKRFLLMVRVSFLIPQLLFMLKLPWIHLLDTFSFIYSLPLGELIHSHPNAMIPKFPSLGQMLLVPRLIQPPRAPISSGMPCYLTPSMSNTGFLFSIRDLTYLSSWTLCFHSSQKYRHDTEFLCFFHIHDWFLGKLVCSIFKMMQNPIWKTFPRYLCGLPFPLSGLRPSSVASLTKIITPLHVPYPSLIFSLVLVTI